MVFCLSRGKLSRIRIMTNSGGVMPDPVLELHGPEVLVSFRIRHGSHISRPKQ